MSITLPAFTPVEESLFLTLCGRALDSRSPRPFLNDIGFPAIVTARRRLMPQRPNAHTIGTDLTGPHWLDEIPAGMMARRVPHADRPTRAEPGPCIISLPAGMPTGQRLTEEGSQR